MAEGNVIPNALPPKAVVELPNALGVDTIVLNADLIGIDAEEGPDALGSAVIAGVVAGVGTAKAVAELHESTGWSSCNSSTSGCSSDE